jgi:hypothetical protein
VGLNLKYLRTALLHRPFAITMRRPARFWGGRQNLVFPLADDLAEHELCWALADRRLF